MNSLILTFTPEEIAILREAAARAGMTLEAWADLALARASQAPVVWSALEVGGARIEWHPDGSATVRWPSGRTERMVENADEYHPDAPPAARLDAGPAGE